MLNDSGHTTTERLVEKLSTLKDDDASSSRRIMCNTLIMFARNNV